jgi:hypothetical protein
MTDDTAATAVRTAATAYGIKIPDDELADVVATHDALRRAVARVLDADTATVDVAVTFDPDRD